MAELSMLSRINELEREVRILKKRLIGSERNRLQMEEMLESHSNALRTRNIELEESRERIRLSEARFRELAMRDTLTQLPNRAYLNNNLDKMLSHAAHTQTNFALLFMDLDHFKHVNDDMGHKIGDAVLVHTAKRLVSCTRAGDVVVRLGGDEFAILLPGLCRSSEAECVALRAINEVSRPVDIDGRICTIGVSIGICIYPTDTRDGEKLMQYADTAMYSVKKTGKNGFRFYSEINRIIE